MDHQSAGSPVHAGVFNPRSYALKNAMGPQPAQLKLGPNAVVCPTDVGKTEAAGSPSLLCHPGHVDHRYLSDIAVGHTLVSTHIPCDDVCHAAHRTNQNPVYAPTHPMDIDYLGSHHERFNCQIQHHLATPYTTSGIEVVATGPANAGNRTFRANSSSVSQKKGHDNCEPRKCLYLGPNGTRCMQEITCATVSEHFISHGIVKKPRHEMIPCQWYECSEEVVRHNFVRHIREKHLRHVRGSVTRNSEKECGYCAFNTGSVEVEMSR